LTPPLPVGARFPPLLVLWDQSLIAAWRPTCIGYRASSNDMDVRRDVMRFSRATAIVGDIPRIRVVGLL